MTESASDLPSDAADLPDEPKKVRVFVGLFKTLLEKLSQKIQAWQSWQARYRKHGFALSRFRWNTPLRNSVAPSALGGDSNAVELLWNAEDGAPSKRVLW